MMTMKEAMEKVTKLLKLAQSDNANEAALAAARAQEIVDRYKLTQLTADADAEDVEEIATDVLDDTKCVAAPMWMGLLANALARANECHLHADGGLLMLSGRERDAQVVRYMYSFLVKDVNRLAKRDAMGKGRSWARSFREGCASTLRERLLTQKAETQAKVQAEAAATGSTDAMVQVSQALARIDGRAQALKDYINRTFGGFGKRRGAGVVQGAYEAGKKAGHEISLGAKTGLGRGALALNG